MPYRSLGRYRPPPRLHRFINRGVAILAAWGLTPENTVALEVPGRRSGCPRRTAVVSVDDEGRRYLVSLAGESEWVRNVRAAAGRAVLRHGTSIRVRLVELRPEERPPVLRAYTSHRAFSRSPAFVARNYFGVDPDPTLPELAARAERYPVFLVEPDTPLCHGAGPCMGGCTAGRVRRRPWRCARARMWAQLRCRRWAS